MLTNDIENFPGRDKTGMLRRFSSADASPGPPFLLSKTVAICGRCSMSECTISHPHNLGGAELMDDMRRQAER